MKETEKDKKKEKEKKLGRPKTDPANQPDRAEVVCNLQHL
jgi:hypothetical protein